MQTDGDGLRDGVVLTAGLVGQRFGIPCAELLRDEEQIGSLNEDTNVLETNLVDQSLRQRITDVEVLQTQVATVAQPEGRGTEVVLAAAIAQTGICGIDILIGGDAQHLGCLAVDPSVLQHALEDVAPLSFAEGIDILTKDERRGLAGTLEVEVEVEALPCHRETETIDEVRTVGSTDGTLVAIVDDTVTIHIFIFNITGLYGTELLYG